MTKRSALTPAVLAKVVKLRSLRKKDKNKKVTLCNYMQGRLKIIFSTMLLQLKNTTKAWGMKLSLILTFLGVMLFCGMLLSAAGNNKTQFIIKKKTKEVTNIKLKREMKLMPNALLL